MEAVLTARDSARSAHGGRAGSQGGLAAASRVDYRSVEPEYESVMTAPHATQGARVDVTVAARLLSLAKVAQRRRVHR